MIEYLARGAIHGRSAHVADLRNAIAAPQMPPYQIGITSDDGNRVAQLLAGDAKDAAPMIQAIDVTDIYSGRKTASVYIRCGQVHVLLPFVGWADAHFAVSICPRNRIFHSGTQSFLFACRQMTAPARAR
jgi:hypothetical protein